MKNKRISILLIIAVLALLSFIFFRVFSTLKENGPPIVEKLKPAAAKHGMVATANRHATLAGVEVLKRGGNAVDAAVAAALALGVVEPFASGIGGGGFMVIYSAKSGKIVTLDYRETAPLRASRRIVPASSGVTVNAEIREGHSSVAVPGTVAGLATALEKYGSMGLKDITAPAIELAENGFEVSSLLNRMMRTNIGKLSRFPESARVYLKNGRLPYEVGERLYQRDLADTLRLLADKGPSVFYGGSIAEAMEMEMRRAGTGLIGMKDLAAYRPRLRPPVRGSYRGYEIYSMGPPSSGGTHVIQILNMMEGYGVSRLGLNSSESIPPLVAAMRQAFSDRAHYMGDPDFVNIPLDRLISSRYAEQLRREMTRNQSGGGGRKANPSPFESDQTSHISVIDGDGNMVALTQTLNAFFGSGVTVPGTGILLNNEMNDFAPVPGHPNSVAPGKRPLSSMSPTLVLKDGKPFMTIGMPGAVRIITVLPQILMNIIDHEMDIQNAVDAPRIHSMDGKNIYVEARLPKEVRDSLTRRGFQVIVKKNYDLYFGGAQAVVIDMTTGALHGAADPRREGYVLGF